MANHKLKYYFLGLFDKQSTVYKEPYASKLWDSNITNKDTQHAISRSKKAQMQYAYVESRLAHNHAMLVDIQLRNIFLKMRKKDFANSAGFSRDSKATPNQLEYFKTRNILSFLMNDDIIGHAERDIQLHSFRRWITVAEVLLKRHNYEGFFLVLTTLSELDTHFKFNKELPKYSQNSFNALLALISPFGGFDKLRNYIEAYKNPLDFPPLCLFSSKITVLDQVIGENYEHCKSSDLLTEDKKLKDEDLADTYKYIVNKEQLIKKIMNTRSAKTKELPDHLKLTLSEATLRYNAMPAGQKLSDLPQAPQSPSTLFSKNLRPSFWGQSKINRHWQKIYEVTNIQNILQNQNP